jgi:hypothetical protein
MYLVTERGMKEVDAWYLISCFTTYSGMTKPTSSDFKILGLTLSDVRAGSHWGISDASSGAYVYIPQGGKAASSIAFDFKRARTGNVNLLPVPPINGFFCSDVPGRIGFKLPENIKPKTTGGRFSQGYFYDTDEVVNEFYKWQDQEGVLA